MGMTMRVAAIRPHVYTDGPGERVSLYLGGCSIGRSAAPCIGCQSPHLWREDGWPEREVADVAAELLAYNLPVTIIGGEPMDQAPALAALLATIRERRPEAHIIVYSGYTLEELRSRFAADCATFLGGGRGDGVWAMAVLAFADVLVDGRFVRSEDDDFVQWRGSRNQRPINLRATHEQRRWDDPVLEDWDALVFQEGDDGDVIVPAGLIPLVREDGDAVQAHRRCGQVGRVEGP